MKKKAAKKQIKKTEAKVIPLHSDDDDGEIIDEKQATLQQAAAAERNNDLQLRKSYTKSKCN